MLTCQEVYKKFPLRKGWEFLLFANIGKTGAMIIIPIDLLDPHGKGTNPQTAFTIKCPIDDHGLFGFGMTGDADYFIFHAFEMTIFANLKFHKSAPFRKEVGREIPGPQI